MNKGFPARLIGFQRENVAAHAAVRAEAAPDLLPPMPGRLSSRLLAAGKPRVFLQLVDAIQGGHVGRGGQARPHSEAVDWRAGFQQVLEAVLIKAAAGEYVHFFESSLVKNAPHAF